MFQCVSKLLAVFKHRTVKNDNAQSPHSNYKQIFDVHLFDWKNFLLLTLLFLLKPFVLCKESQCCIDNCKAISISNIVSLNISVLMALCNVQL